MANKFFSYGFQVRRSKKAGIVFVIFLIIVLTISILWYRSKNNYTYIDRLGYQVSFGINEFEDNSCDKAYKVNYDKNTCGTLCINKRNKDSEYLKDVKSQMEANGFMIGKIKRKKINQYNWSYFHTSNDGPIISYYVNDDTNKTYIVEKIDQSQYLTKKNREKCGQLFDEMMDSLKIR